MFKGDYLRVRTPVTSDGVSPVVENDRIKYREDHLPVTAKKMLERKNEKLPSSLRKKIEVVSANIQPVFTRSPKPAQVEDEFSGESQDFETPMGEETTDPAPEKKKGGRPKKVNNG